MLWRATFQDFFVSSSRTICGVTKKIPSLSSSNNNSRSSVQVDNASSSDKIQRKRHVGSGNSIIKPAYRNQQQQGQQGNGAAAGAATAAAAGAAAAAAAAEAATAGAAAAISQ